MATDKPRYSVTMEVETLEGVNRFRAENNIATQSKAIIKLVELALNDMQESGIISNLPSYSDEGEKKLVNMYRNMSKEGQEKVLAYAEDIADTGKYKKCCAVRVDTKEA